jgi:hypothetical protein
MTAPSATSRRHHAHTHHNADAVEPANANLFIDPMMGAPLAIYIEKDVPDKDAIAELIVVGLRHCCFSYSQRRSFPSHLPVA